MEPAVTTGTLGLSHARHASSRCPMCGATLRCPRRGKSNVTALGKPGALFRSVDGVAIPRTICDAMYLVKSLGEKYLWVDCLCLVQDAEGKEMQSMLRAMACIYASAEFTIVAAGGSNADYGLPGVGGSAENRMPNAALRKKDRDGFPWDSTWASRGWTFQESLFSRRLLIFKDFVSWICGRCMWLEDVLDSLERPKKWPLQRPHLGVPTGLSSLISRHPCLGRWGMLAENFSSRALTYEEDVVRAFAGATDFMDSAFPGGLLHGLPVFFLDIALLWQPASSISRRPGQPSWSWIGWKGPIDCLRSWSLFYPGVYRNCGESSYWVATANLKCLASYQIEGLSADTQSTNSMDINRFYKYQELRKKPCASLPAGWTRTVDPDGDYYTHKGYEGEDFRFSYPLPLVTYPLQRLAPPSSPILICTAPVAKLSSSAIEVYRPNTSEVVILLQKKLSVGEIIMHNQSNDRSHEFSRWRYDLVAISEAVVQDPSKVFPDFRISSLSEGMQDARRINFYNVLLIEWDNGVAYRKGIGVVNREAWDSIGAQTVTFKLG